MALPALMSGADCGPSNPLQALSKQFERDRGIQQDHFGPARAGPSREVFRTQSAPTHGVEEDAARFFSGKTSSSATFVPQHTPNAFDLSALRIDLPPQQKRLQSPPISSAWAGDFLSHQSIENSTLKAEASDFPLNPLDNNRTHVNHTTHLPPSYFFESRPSMQHGPMFHEASHPELAYRNSEAAAAVIHAHFPPEEEVSTQQQASAADLVDADELARTAGLLIDTVKDETNPKFQQSAFLGLMRQLRDREMVVDGSEMVKNPTAVPSGDNLVGLGPLTHNDLNVSKWHSSDAHAKIHEVPRETHSRIPFVPSESDPIALEQQQIRQGNRELLNHPEHIIESEPRFSTHGVAPRKSVHFDRPEVVEHGMSGIEDSDDAFWRQENEEYGEYWRNAHEVRRDKLYASTPEWDRLQEDWDRFEPNNPYVLGESSTRKHALHTHRLESNESVLEKEAAVQHNTRSATAWFELGVKQQENERESKAIQALRRAVELDPSHLAAWLALAISYTNENDRNSAYDAIEHWVQNNERYTGVQLMTQLENVHRTEGSRLKALIECLVEMARTEPEGRVDADIQTALGVLLNTGEDYAKAYDCFRTALDVRPTDWLLYNRVGATLANSGRADEALWYYYRALDLNPAYIRARFNLGISYINMKKYREAAEHILDALSLQESDAFESPDMRGITSSALWDCLRTTCVHLQRSDLTAHCDVRDLDGFRDAFMDMPM